MGAVSDRPPPPRPRASDPACPREPARPNRAPHPHGSPGSLGPLVLGLNAIIVAVTDEVPRIVTVPFPEAIPPTEPSPSFPFGPLDVGGHKTLERALREWVGERTGLELGYVEQLYTFGDRYRNPTERSGGGRVVSVAYLALVHKAETSGTARWHEIYDFLPWEDGRSGRPKLIDATMSPAFDRWIAKAEDPALGRARRERVDIAFGLHGVPWDGYRVLERYELLYEAGLVAERHTDLREASLRGAPPTEADAAETDPAEAGPAEVTGPAETEPLALGRPMALDHRRILANALTRLRGKLKYRPVVFELLPPVFTLLMLQRLIEALSGVRLHKQNFRRLVDRSGLVEGTGERNAHTGGRPAELFRFRRDVLRERPAPGVGYLPGIKR